MGIPNGPVCQAVVENVPCAIIIRMGIGMGLIIAIVLGLVGAFFCYRAGLRAMQVARCQASWPERRKLMAVSWRYIGLAFLLIILVVAGPIFAYNNLNIFRAQVTRPEPTETEAPLKTFTNTTAPTDTPAPTGTPTPTNTLAGTFTATRVQNSTPIPAQTRWPTLTPSDTPTKTPIPSATKVLTGTSTTVPSATATLPPTKTPLPTQTRWPTHTPTPTRTIPPPATHTPF